MAEKHYDNADKTDRARSQLSPEQIAFAEWLALPLSERKPKTQMEFAEQLGVGSQALTHWKKIPETWEVRDSLISTIGKEMVSEALKTIKDMLKSDNSKVALDAAKDILDRWSEPKRHATIIASIKDMYELYNKPTH